MNRKIKAVIFLLLAVALAAGGVLAGIRWSSRQSSGEAQTGAAAETDKNAEEYTGDRETYTGEKNTDTIDIPGYRSITLKAGETRQAVNFHNPEQNTCYFRISLLLSDGTTLWQSGLIGPGKGVYEIELNKALEAGTYEDAVLKYECFTMDEAQTPLNGSEITLTIHVLE